MVHMRIFQFSVYLDFLNLSELHDISLDYGKHMVSIREVITFLSEELSISKHSFIMKGTDNNYYDIDKLFLWVRLKLH